MYYRLYFSLQGSLFIMTTTMLETNVVAILEDRIILVIFTVVDIWS